MVIGERVGRAVAWAGIATFGILAFLASAHLAADLLTVARASGIGPDLLARLGPPIVLGLGAVALLLLVTHLAGGDARRRGVAIGIGLAVLVGVRIGIAVAFDGVGDGEPREYQQLADRVLAGECCMGDRPMGYPMILALGFSSGLDRQVVIEGLNLMFAVVAGAAVLGIGERLHGSRVGAAALLAYAVWPAGALMTGVSLPHTAYDSLVAGAAWLATGGLAGWRGSALIGLVLGLGQYMRPSTLVLLPAFALARAWPGGPWRRLLGGTLLPMAAVAFLVMIPAIWHNATAYGELSPSTSTYGGHILYMGTDVRSGGRFDGGARDELEAIVGSEEPRALSEAGSRIAFERIRSDPLGIALLAIRKQDTLWSTERYGVEYGIDRGLRERPANPRATTPLLLSQGFIALVYAATCAALFLRRRDLDALAVLAIALVWSLALMHALLEVRDRYHAYVIPVLLPVAAVAVVALIDAAGRWRRARASSPVRAPPSVPAA